MGSQDPRGLFIVKVHILKFFKLILILIEKSFKISSRSCSVHQIYGVYRGLTPKSGKIIKNIRKRLHEN